MISGRWRCLTRRAHHLEGLHQLTTVHLELDRASRCVFISSSFLFSIFVFPLDSAEPFSVVPFCLYLYFLYLPYLFLRDWK